MRVKYFYIHCSDTPLRQPVTPADLHKWHVIERGWSRVGYNHLIGVNGERWDLIPYDDDGIVEWNEVANGVAGDNSQSYHLCIAGGRSWDGKRPMATYTGAQVKVVKEILTEVITKFPWIKIRGHYQNESTTKSCPNFDVPQFLQSIGIPAQNIDFGGRKFPL